MQPHGLIRHAVTTNQRLLEEFALKKNYMDLPVVIQLETIATGISVNDLVDAIFKPLQRDLREQLFKHEPNFSILLYTQSQRFSPRPDFRCNLVFNLLPEPPWSSTNTIHIQRRLELDADAFPDYVQEARQRLTGADLDLLEQRLSELPANHARDNMPEATSAAGMYRYIWLELGRRIYRMLSHDIAIGKLIATGEGDDAFVFLDDLVAWANGHRIIIDQEALPNCAPLVADAYVRLRQKLSLAATEAAKSSCPLQKIEVPHCLATAKKGEPVSRATAQESAIIDAIKKRNLNPEHLPARERGARTVKAEIRTELLKQTSIFQSKRIFDTAWQRLRDQGRIADEPPPLPQNTPT